MLDQHLCCFSLTPPPSFCDCDAIVLPADTLHGKTASTGLLPISFLQVSAGGSIQGHMVFHSAQQFLD